jgi:hypothetical protein
MSDTSNSNTAFVPPSPGEFVGGEDRKTPDGGAVVDGYYIPPNTDFAGLQGMVPADWEQAAKELYGGYYSIIEKYPDLKNLLLAAVSFKYSPEKFNYELRQTKWWKETTASARQWDLQAGLDPATAQSKVEDQAMVIRDAALTAGVRFTDAQLANLAENSLRWQWTTQDLNNAIAVELQKTGSNALAQGYWGQSVRADSNKFGVRLSESQINDWSSRLFTGKDNSQSFNDYLTNAAKVLYPTLSSGFDRGLSFSDLTDPYAQLASQILEIPATQVNFADPKWAKAFTGLGQNGDAKPMSYGEYADYLRSDPRFGYEYTDDAKNRAFTVVNRLAELFGAA